MKRLCTVLLAGTLALPGAALAQDWNEERAGEQSDAPVHTRIPSHRYAYAGAGLLLLGGLGVSYWADGYARTANGDLTSARDYQRNLATARTSAATANMLYAMAGVTLAYGLVMELLPEEAADKANLTFRF